MGRRGRKAVLYASHREPTAAREAIERRWFERLTLAPNLATLVTATGAAREPFHRWNHLKHGFSPELVRLFLNDVAGLRGHGSGKTLLDPFSGSGTVVTECARRNVRAVGVEAVASMAFLTSARFAKSFPRLPAIDQSAGWTEIAPMLQESVHRAALLCAVSRCHSSDGKPLTHAPPVGDQLQRVSQMMCEDLRIPLSIANTVVQGDARVLTQFEDHSVGGILTSPPYLSRHDYAVVSGPVEDVYRSWYPDDRRSAQMAQMAAHPRSRRSSLRIEAPVPEIDEVCLALKQAGKPRLAGVVQDYFADLFAALSEMARVLEPGAPCWVVLGGARLKDVYIPSDLILAEFALLAGFFIDDIRVARDLIDVGRKLGTLRRVTPRESILIMHRS